MSDLNEILELIASFFAAVVILLVLLTWLEATMSEDYVPWTRHPWFRRLRSAKTEDRDPPTTGRRGGPLGETHTVEVAERGERAVAHTAMDREVSDDFGIRGLVAYVGRSSEVAEKRHVGHDSHKTVCEASSSQGDAAALAASLYRNARGIDVWEAPHRPKCAQCVHKNAPVVIRLGILDALGHKAGRVCGPAPCGSG